MEMRKRSNYVRSVLIKKGSNRMHQDCIHCGSNRVIEFGKGMMFLIMMFLAGGTFTIGLLILPLLLVAPIAFLIGLVILFIPKEKLQVKLCKDCNKSWKISK